MFLTVQEMKLLCAFYAGTFTETLELLRNAEDERPEMMSVVKNLIAKLENMNEGENVSLHFDSKQ